MPRILDEAQQIERSISKKYRKTIWNPFIKGVKNYNLINANDKIAVCISGGKDSMILAKLMQMLKRYTDVPFELKFIVMNPGYSEANLNQIVLNAEILKIPITVFNSDIFEIVETIDKSPCYLCARMRRGHLYKNAMDLGCNKIALGHHYSDVIETTMLGMLYGGQMQSMMPKLHSTNFEGMELIRPLYCIHEDDIISWKNYNNLNFIQCACRFTEMAANEDYDKESVSKRKEIKELIRTLKVTNKTVESSIFNSIHNVQLDTLIEYKQDGVVHNFLDEY